MFGARLRSTVHTGHTKHFVENTIMFPYNPGWAHGGVTCEMDDGTNVFRGNKVVGVAHPYNCGNNTDTWYASSCS